jgi:signal transduction histidine kinase
MDLTHAALRIYRCGDPSAAFEALTESLAATLPLRAAVRVQSPPLAPTHRWPADAVVTPELCETALHVLRPEIFPLGSDLPAEAAQYAGAEMLLLPYRAAAEDAESVTTVLIAAEGAFGTELALWEPLAEAVRLVEERDGRLRRIEQENERLRRRVDESEALHTLGLAANRTLDRDKVLELVTRFTRTLLGAQYVTADVVEGETVRTVAAVGLRGALPDRESPLARRVVAAAKPLTIGGPDADVRLEAIHFHSEQGMVTGLGIPLSVFGDPFGALIVGYRQAYTLTAHDIRLALTLARHAAVAINNARLHQELAQHSHELEHAYQQLDELTRAKERFYNAISHDLRTPVSAVKGYNELLLQGVAGEMSPQARRYLESSRRAAQTLLSLVSDLLDFAKLEAGKVELDVRPCQLADIVADALATVQPQAAEKELRIVVPPLTEVPPLTTDPKRVCQILVNLLANAVKFTPVGEITLSVAHHPASDDAGMDETLELRLRDSGPGIPTEHRARIFEPFEQMKGSEGTGLGLSVSRRLARLLGGDLAVESELGSGATFVLQLPVYTPASAALPHATA